MFVSKQHIREKRLNFIDKKHGVLSTQAGKPERIYIPYSADNFANFLNEIKDSGSPWLRVYFASIDNLLTLVYAIKNTLGTSEIYYQVDKNSYVKKPKADVAPWINEYQKNKKPHLDKQFDPTHHEKGETVAVNFEMKDVIQFILEIECQKPMNINAYFVAYSNKESIFKKKMHLEYVFTRLDSEGNEEEFFIDDCEDFSKRPPLEKSSHFNNGTLCPPCTGCDDSGFPPEGC